MLKLEPQKPPKTTPEPSNADQPVETNATQPAETIAESAAAQSLSLQQLLIIHQNVIKCLGNWHLYRVALGQAECLW